MPPAHTLESEGSSCWPTGMNSGLYRPSHIAVCVPEDFVWRKSMEDAATFSITKGEKCLVSAREFRPKEGRGD